MRDARTGWSFNDGQAAAGRQLDRRLARGPLDAGHATSRVLAELNREIDARINTRESLLDRSFRIGNAKNEVAALTVGERCARFSKTHTTIRVLGQHLFEIESIALVISLRQQVAHN